MTEGAAQAVHHQAVDQMKRRRWRRWMLGVLAAVLLLLIVFRALLPGWVEKAIEENLGGALGVDLQIGDVDLGVLRGTLRLNEVAVRNPAGYSSEEFFAAESASLNLGVLSLFGPAVVVQAVEIRSPVLVCERPLGRDSNAYALFGGKQDAVADEAGPDDSGTQPAEEPPEKPLVLKKLLVTGADLRFSNQEPERYAHEAGVRLGELEVRDVLLSGEMPEAGPSMVRVRDLVLLGPSEYPEPVVLSVREAKAVLSLPALDEERLEIEELAVIEPRLEVAMGPDDRTNLKKARRVMTYSVSAAEEEEEGEEEERPDRKASEGSTVTSSREADGSEEGSESLKKSYVRRLSVTDGFLSLGAKVGEDWEREIFADVDLLLEFPPLEPGRGDGVPFVFSLHARQPEEGRGIQLDASGTDIREISPEREFAFKLEMRGFPFHALLWDEWDREVRGESPRVVHALMNVNASGKLEGVHFTGEAVVSYGEVVLTRDERPLLARLRGGGWATTLDSLLRPDSERTRDVSYDVDLDLKGFNPFAIYLAYVSGFHRARNSREE